MQGPVFEAKLDRKMSSLAFVASMFYPQDIYLYLLMEPNISIFDEANFKDPPKLTTRVLTREGLSSGAKLVFTLVHWVNRWNIWKRKQERGASVCADSLCVLEEV